MKVFEIVAGKVKELKLECEYCGGEGVLSTDVDDGEGHLMQGVGEEKCICQLEN